MIKHRHISLHLLTAATLLLQPGYIGSGAAQQGLDIKIPEHFKPSSSGCRPGSGYSLVASAPGHPSTYPKLLLRVFDGEVIGFVFEVEVRSGWKPWYDQPEGKPISHGGGPAHYSHSTQLKKGPTAEECAASKGPWREAAPR